MDVKTELLPAQIEEDELYSSKFDVKDTWAPLTDVTTIPGNFQFLDDDENKQDEGEMAA